MFLPIGTQHHIRADLIEQWTYDPASRRVVAYLTSNDNALVFEGPDADFFRLAFYNWVYHQEGNPLAKLYNPWELVQHEINDLLADQGDRITRIPKPIHSMDLAELFKVLQWARKPPAQPTGDKKTGQEAANGGDVTSDTAEGASASPEPPTGQTGAIDDQLARYFEIGIQKIDHLEQLRAEKRPITPAMLAEVRQVLFAIQELDPQETEEPAASIPQGKIVTALKTRIGWTPAADPNNPPF